MNETYLIAIQRVLMVCFISMTMKSVRVSFPLLVCSTRKFT